MANWKFESAVIQIRPQVCLKCQKETKSGLISTYPEAGIVCPSCMGWKK